MISLLFTNNTAIRIIFYCCNILLEHNAGNLARLLTLKLYNFLVLLIEFLFQIGLTAFPGHLSLFGIEKAANTFKMRLGLGYAYFKIN